jgi:hypothetical protein
VRRGLSGDRRAAAIDELVGVSLFALLDFQTGLRGSQGAGLAGRARSGRFIGYASIVDEISLSVGAQYWLVRRRIVRRIARKERRLEAIGIVRRSRLHACNGTEAGEGESDDENFAHFNFPKFVFTISVRGINSRARCWSVVCSLSAFAYRSMRNLNART